MKTRMLKNFKGVLIACSLILFSSTVLKAQPEVPPSRDDMEARRVGFLTTMLQLTPQEAQNFWPVYNKFQNEMEALRKDRAEELMSAKMNFNDYTDDQVNKLIDNEFDSRQKELDLARRYNVEFKKILPVKKVAKLYRAEQQFKISLLKDMHPGKDDHDEPWRH